MINFEIVNAVIFGNVLTCVALMTLTAFAYSVRRFIAYTSGKVSALDQLRTAGRKVYLDRYKRYQQAKENPNFPVNDLQNYERLLNATVKEYKLRPQDVKQAIKDTN